jgi:hypothetical protein
MSGSQLLPAAEKNGAPIFNADGILAGFFAAWIETSPSEGKQNK